MTQILLDGKPIQSVVVDSCSSAYLDLEREGWVQTHACKYQNGRRYELVNSRWRRVVTGTPERCSLGVTRSGPTDTLLTWGHS